jgi:hypothetical protein
MREGRAVLTLKKRKDRLVLISIIFFRKIPFSLTISTNRYLRCKLIKASPFLKLSYQRHILLSVYQTQVALTLTGCLEQGNFNLVLFRSKE